MEKTMERNIAFAIAEDEAIEREAMQEFISETFENACVIWTAQDGREALEKVEKEAPDMHCPCLCLIRRMPVRSVISFTQ